MFSGIIEKTTRVLGITTDGTNKVLEIQNPYEELYIDQSIAHNGVCLTVVKITDNSYVVEAIEETLLKSNIGDLREGDMVNLERCMLPTTRIDGHIVQGHVDDTGIMIESEEKDGSWSLKFKLDEQSELLVVPKGSICINGVSLTVVSIQDRIVEVAIIPYTYEHTNFSHLTKGDRVNIEYDILGKYIANYMQKKNA